MTPTPDMRVVGSSLAPGGAALAGVAVSPDSTALSSLLQGRVSSTAPQETWQTRLGAELTQLQARVTKLEEFMLTNAYAELDELDRDLLRAQWGAMCAYANVLRVRATRAGVLSAPGARS